MRGWKWKWHDCGGSGYGEMEIEKERDERKMGAHGERGLWEWMHNVYHAF